jgi:hypothetical protein
MCGFAFLMVAARGNNHAREVGQMGHKFAVASGVGPQAVRAVELRQRRGLGYITRVKIKGPVCIKRVEIKGV